MRAFIEDELLTDAGFRESMALERARRLLTQRGAPASALDDLVQRRLLHVEERLEVQHIELTHDVLTEVIKESRDERQQQEAAQEAQRHEQEVREQLRQSRRKRTIVAAVMVMTVVLAVMSALGLISYKAWRKADKQRPKPSSSEIRPNKQRPKPTDSGSASRSKNKLPSSCDIRPRSRELLARQMLYLSRIRLAPGGRRDGEIDQASNSSIARIGRQPSRGAQDLRGWEWYYLKGLCTRGLVNLRGAH